jgi:chemotaxis protein methyltransferase CheR
MERLSRGDLERLATLVSRRSGMVFPESRWPFLRRQAGGVMLRSGFTSVARWAEELERPGRAAGRLYADLEEALQVSASRFFRYAQHYECLGRSVIPALVQDGDAGGRRLRFWSVGCATGEEPYSVAMVLREHLPAESRTRVDILGVDASRTALRAAERATYRAPSVAGVPPAYLAKYFTVREGLFTVVPAVREAVTLVYHDVRRGFYMGKFDVIFCCNVLLYYTADLRRRILDGLAAALHRRGVLFLGHADGIVPPPELFEPLPCPGGFAYRRA